LAENGDDDDDEEEDTQVGGSNIQIFCRKDFFLGTVNSWLTATFFGGDTIVCF